MPVQHTFNFVTPTGQTYVSFGNWIKTLSAEDQAAYATVFAAQQALEQQQIADGDLVIHEPGHQTGRKVYSDAAVEKAKQGEFSYVTPEFRTWFDRYQTETGITLDNTVATI
jgi:hypothetical protein